MADYDWFDNSPSTWEIEAAQWRAQGYTAEFKHSGVGRVCGIKYYFCRRGCGTLVWNPEEHSRNVCRTFNPTVGN